MVINNVGVNMMEVNVEINSILLLAIIFIAIFCFVCFVIKMGKNNEINRWLESNRKYATIKYKNNSTKEGIIYPEITTVDNKKAEDSPEVSPVAGGMLDRKFYITAGEHNVRIGAFLGSVSRREIHDTESMIDFQEGNVYIISYDDLNQKFIVGHEVNMNGIKVK
jgi:hypothetical protein